MVENGSGPVKEICKPLYLLYNPRLAQLRWLLRTQYGNAYQNIMGTVTTTLRVTGTKNKAPHMEGLCQEKQESTLERVVAETGIEPVTFG